MYEIKYIHGWRLARTLALVSMIITLIGFIVFFTLMGILHPYFDLDDLFDDEVLSVIASIVLGVGIGTCLGGLISAWIYNHWIAPKMGGIVMNIAYWGYDPQTPPPPQPNQRPQYQSPTSVNKKIKKKPTIKKIA